MAFQVHTQASEYFYAWGNNPHNYYLAVMQLGVFIGGLFSALFPGRIKVGIERANAAPFYLRLFLQPSEA